MNKLYLLVGAVLVSTFTMAQHNGWTVYSSKQQNLASTGTGGSGIRSSGTGFSGGRSSTMSHK